MTELELLEVLGEAQDAYIRQTQDFRSGKTQVRRERKQPRRQLPALLATAAVAAILVTASWRLLSAQWKTGQAETASEQGVTVDATLATDTGPVETQPPVIPELEDWCDGVLMGTRTFESKTYGGQMTLEEYTQHYANMAKDGKCRATVFTQLDMDSDGEPELLIAFDRRGSRELTLLLGMEDGTIISQEFWAGGIGFLERSGSFYEVSKFPNGSWLKLRRENGAWVTEEIPDHADFPVKDGMEWYDVKTYQEK